MRIRALPAAGRILCAALAIATGGGLLPAAAQMPPSALADPGQPLALPGPLGRSPGAPLAPPGAAGLPNRPGPALAPISPSAPTKTVLGLSASYAQGSALVSSGLRWRVFADMSDVNGNHALVYETTEPRPLLTLDPGGYIVHVTYGLVNQTRHVVLGAGAENERFVLDCGALRFTGLLGKEPIAAQEVTFDVHKVEGGIETMVASAVQAGQIVRLPAGSYQVTSTYGSGNARVVSEVGVQPGRLTDATVHHRAARIRLRLLHQADGQPVRNASWSVLTPGGDPVAEQLGELPDVVLAEGEYVAVARLDGRTFHRPFTVQPGAGATVSLLMQ